jgi:membrane-associated phospholipid phosphatase
VLIVVTTSYFWFDEPVAFFAHDHLRQEHFFVFLTRIPEVFPPLAIPIFFAIGLRLFARPAVHKHSMVLFLASVSLLVAESIKQQLKFAFGRTWPESWTGNNPSLIANGAYGFHPFHGGVGWESFPSGHTVAVCAVASVLWLSYPRLRLPCVITIIAVVIGLLGANYHFLSDTIAGGFLGTTVGWITVTAWRTRSAPSPAGGGARRTNVEPIPVSSSY